MTGLLKVSVVALIKITWVVYKSSKISLNLTMTSLSVCKLKHSFSQSRFENLNFWAYWPKVTSKSSSDRFFSFYILLTWVMWLITTFTKTGVMLGVSNVLAVSTLMIPMLYFQWFSMFSHFRNWFKQSANFKSVILADPQIICTCDTTYPDIGEPGETPDPAQCLNKPIVFYLLWIEDDFGIGTLEHYDVFAHFLDQLYDQVK